LAWLIVNRVFVVEFLFSSPEGKIELAKGSAFNLTTDLIAPLGLALLYTYGLPFIQFFIDKTKHKLIDKKRIEEHHGRRADEYKAQMVASEYQAKSSISYQQDKLNRDLDNWGQQREEYESRIENLNTQLDSGTEQLALITAELEKAKQEQESNLEKIAVLTEENQHQMEQIEVFKEMSDQFERTKNKLTSVEDNIERLQAELTSEKNNKTTLEDMALAFYDSMVTSDANIRSDLHMELTLRSGINEKDIDVIADSFITRVKQYRSASHAYYGSIKNLKRKKEERSKMKKFNNIKISESKAKAMPQGIDV
jgi:chromosome segregation ATPase